MITASIDTQSLARQITQLGREFGDTNESAVARWGVSTCRVLTSETRAWGDGAEAKKKQESAIWKDANRAVFTVEKKSYVNQVASGRLSGLVISGELVTFTPDRILKTPQEVVDFIDGKRTSSKKRVPNMARSAKGIAAKPTMEAAMKIKFKSIGKAKGGWIGAGLSIAVRQRSGSRITIGQNHYGYAHKFKSGGTSQLTANQWNPVGKLINNVSYVSTDYVLRNSDIEKAVNQGARNTITWYNRTMQARLNRRRR